MTHSSRTLFVTQQVPHPVIGGVALRNWQNINTMGNYGEVAVFSVSTWTPKHTSIPDISLWKHCNVAEGRTFSEKLAQRLWWLRRYGYPGIDWCYANEAAQQLDEMMADFKPDIVVFEEVWLYRYLSIVQRYQCHTILDEHNIEVDNFAQNNANPKTLKEKVKVKRQLPQIKALEEAFIDQVDQVWVCSHEDTQLLNRWFDTKTPSYVVPNGLNAANYDELYQNRLNKTQESEQYNRTIIFMGQLAYLPNKVGVELFLQETYPKIKEMYPDCKFLIVGRNPSPLMAEAAEKDPSITITGWVSEVIPYLGKASIMIVPLLQGGGTRFKILEAFAAGCPVVSTSKGCEGLNATDGEHLLIRDGADALAQGVAEIWSNPTLTDNLVQKGYELFQSNYSWQAIAEKIDVAVNSEQLVVNSNSVT
ncbi:MAG: glycosyltransferase family 4 protein [Microcystaceae cyanobacterium]